MNKFKIGDNVNFVKDRMMYSGKITKLYKNYYNREACSVATEVGTFPHILLQKVAKIKDSSFVDEKDKQIAELQHKLKVADKALEIQNKSLEKCEQWLWEDEELLDNYEDAGGSVCHTFYQPIEHFKEQAEKEVQGENK